jgi:hypothetical protein
MPKERSAAPDAGPEMVAGFLRLALRLATPPPRPLEVCQKSAGPKRQQFPNTGAWHDRCSRPVWGALAGIRARWQKFPCSRTQRNRRRGRRAGPDQRCWPRRKAGVRAISLYFPCGSGIPVRRRVRDRPHPRPFSLRVQSLPGRDPALPEKSRGFAGSWRSSRCCFRERLLPDEFEELPSAQPNRRLLHSAPPSQCLAGPINRPARSFHRLQLIP